MASDRRRVRAMLFLCCAFITPSVWAQTTYEYDALGRLYKVNRTSPTVTTTYNLDEVGNRTSVVSGTAPTAVFSIDDKSATEGGNLVFTVTKTGSTSYSHDVSYATANNTAVSTSDYTAASGVLTFAPSETSKTVTISSVNDSLFELQETFYVNLSGATNGASISDNQGVGTINDNDTAPAFSVNDVSADEGSNLTFTVTKSGSASLTHGVTYATANGTATAGSDYTSASGSLSFGTSETTKTVTVATATDSEGEGSETVLLNLSSATNGATISDSQGVGTILNVGPPPSFSVSDASADENDPLVFTVTRSGDLSGTNAVDYASADNTATSPSDYSAGSGTLTFAPSESTKEVSLATSYGSNGEPGVETMYLNLSNATGGASISDSQGVGSIANVPLCGGEPC